MADELQPSSPSSVQPNSEPTPTLLELGIDQSWGVTASGAVPSQDALLEEPESPQGIRRLLPPAIRRWLDRRAIVESVDELPTDETVPVDLTPDPPWKTILKTLAAFVTSALLAYLVLTFPTQLARASYFFEHLGEDKAPAKIVQSTAVSGSFRDVVVPSLSFRAPTDLSPSQPSNQPTPSTTGNELTKLADNQLYIPKLNVRAPIVWDSSFEEKIMLENLQKGVVHYGGTDFPSQEKGNVFITGHSSYYWWDKGQYKTVFALLPNLASGDQAALTYQDKVYVYEVFEVITVKPSQVEVLESTPQPILSLMTCVPVGTSLNRLIVKAKLVGVYTQDEPAAPAERSTTEPPPNEPAPPAEPATAQPAAEPSSSPELWQLLPGLR